MKKFSKKRLEKYLDRYINDITIGYISHGGKKDKRSQKITVADKKKAKKLFELDVRQKMKDNPGMTTIDAALKVKRSNRFNIYSDISKENMQRALKEFGINVQKRSLQYDKTLGTYKITGGKYKDKTVTTVHTPGSYPSYQLVLV